MLETARPISFTIAKGRFPTMLDMEKPVMKIYSRRDSFKSTKRHVHMLYPFWGKNPEDEVGVNSGRFDHYIQAGKGIFEMVSSLEDADVAVLAAPWEYLCGNQEDVFKAAEFVDMAKSLQKPTVLFFFSDSFRDVPLEGTVVFRTSFYRSQKKPNESAMPAWNVDFVKKHLGSHLPVRPKKKKPVVSFCGIAEPIQTTMSHRIKELFELELGRISKARYPSRVVRARALRILAGSPLVGTNFIIRSGFFSDALGPDGVVNVRQSHRARQDYVANMVESDYVLCMRGGGNFSYRLYETLSCGRIPLFIDTDCVLPYDFMKDWKNYCIWVPEEELHLVADKVAEFHDSISSDDFIGLQHDCRRFWEQYLSPTGFFRNFHRHFGA